jgi:hypothetical protein
MSEGKCFVYNGAVIDATAISERKDYETAKRQAESVVLGLNGSNQLQENRTLFGLKPAQGFQSRDRTAGFYASFNPHVPVHPDIIHPDRAFGHLVGVNVDLSENVELASNQGNSVTRATDIVKMICGAIPATGSRNGPSLTSVDADGKDIGSWKAAIVGGGFVGLYANPDEPENGMLVVCTRGWNDAKQRQQDLAEVVARPSYVDFATSKPETFARELARRNALRLLCDVAEGLGFSTSVKKAVIPDPNAVPNPESVPPPNMGKAFGNGIVKDSSFAALLATLRDRPWMAVPQVENVTNVFESESADGVVSLFDGVVSVRSAVGSLVAFMDGNPKTGLLVCPKEKYVAEHAGHGWTSRSFDPGYEVAAGEQFVASKWLVENAVKYLPCFPIVTFSS